MEEDWLTNLLNPEAAMMMPAAPIAPMPESKTAAARSNRRKGGGTYITPPTLRKNDHVPAAAMVAGSTVRAPVLAVKVVETLEVDEDSSLGAFVGRETHSSLSNSSQPPALTRDASTASASSSSSKREKRSRKAPPAAKPTDGYASNGESPPIRPRHVVPYAAATEANPETWAAAADPAAFAVDVEPTTTAAAACDAFGAPFDLDDEISSRAVADMNALMAPGAFAEMTLMPSRQTTMGTDIGPPFDSDPTDEHAAAREGMPDDSNRRKVRHNLTERRRVDRMNQLFNKLYTAIEDTAPGQICDAAGNSASLGVCGADGKPINPARWSKADVLEGALNVIYGLRKQLEEERLARSVSAPLSANPAAAAAAANIAGSDGAPSSNGDHDSLSVSDSVSEAGGQYEDGAGEQMQMHMHMQMQMHMLHPLSAMPSINTFAVDTLPSINAHALAAAMRAQQQPMRPAAQM